MNLKLIQWFGNDDIESFSSYCIGVTRLLSASKLPFDVVTFSVPEESKVIEHRLSDVPVLRNDKTVIKGYVQCIDYLRKSGFIRRLIPDNEHDRLLCQMTHEWSILNFFPMSTYFSYGDDESFKRLKILMRKSKVFSDPVIKERANLIKQSMKEQLTSNVYLHPIFSMNRSEAEAYFLDHLQMIVELIGKKRFFISDYISVCDITTFSVLVRLFYGAPEILEISRARFIPLFKWMERVEQMTNGPKTIYPFCLK